MNFKSAFTYESTSGIHYSYKPLTSKYPEPTDNHSLLTNTVSYALIIFTYIFIILTMPLSLIFTIKLVPAYEKLVVFRLGRFISVKNSGIQIILPFIERFERVNMAVKAFYIPPMLVILSDQSSVSVGGVVMYRITDARKVVIEVQDVNHALRNISQGCLHFVLSQQSIDDVLKRKAFLEKQLLDRLNNEVSLWGLNIEKAEISDTTVINEPPSPIDQIKGVIGPLLNQSGSSNLLGQFCQPFLNASPNVPVPQKSIAPNVTTGNETLNTIVDKVRMCITEEIVQNVGKIYLFRIQNDDALYEITIDLKNAPGSVRFGSDPDPDATVELSLEDMLSLMHGQLSKMSAFLMGRVSVSGDSYALYELEDLYSKVRPLL